MATIAEKIIGSLGKAIQVTTDKQDIFITKPELAQWIEMYNIQMLSRGLNENVIDLYNKDGSIDNDKWVDAFEVYNSVYLYNLEKSSVLRNKNTGIALVDPVDYGLKIPTKVRGVDKAGTHFRGAEVSDPTVDAAKNILGTVQKNVVPGVMEVVED